jgi:hypothetical protein
MTYRILHAPAASLASAAGCTTGRVSGRRVATDLPHNLIQDCARQPAIRDWRRRLEMDLGAARP